MTAAATEEPPPITSDPPGDAPEVTGEGVAATHGAAGEAVGDGASIAAAELNAAATDAVAQTSTLLSESDRRWLARRNAVEVAKQSVKDARSELAEAEEAEEDAKAIRKGKETALEAAWLELLRAEDEDAAPQQGTLPFDQANRPAPAPSASDAEYNAATREWEKKWDTDFLSQSIDVLELPPSLSEKLRAHTPAIETLATLVKVHGTSDGHGYTVVAGIGKANADKIEAALEEMKVDYLTKNPAPVKPAADAAPTDPAVDVMENEGGDVPASLTDYDFITTFPPFVAETPNESFTDDDHRDLIKEQADEYKSIAESKQCLATGKYLNGEAVTSKNRRVIETSLGETQMQYDSGYDAYAERFGKRAAERLRGHIEGQVEKRESLKGGLDA